MLKFDVVVFGAGPAGTVASSYLARKGFNVLVLERASFPRFVIGESLLPSCMDDFNEAGLLEGIDQSKYQIKYGATFVSGEKKCSFSFDEQYSESWSYTYQVERAKLDMDLAQQAIKNGVEIRFHSEVKSVDAKESQQITHFENAKGEQESVESRYIIDASGYGRVLPRLFDLEKPSSMAARTAVFSHFNDAGNSQVDRNKIEVHVVDESNAWLWLIPLANDCVSVGMVSSLEKANEFQLNESDNFVGFLKNFKGIEKRFKKTEALRAVDQLSGFSVAVKKKYGEGYVLCGNSTEFLDPIFSSGVALATKSALLAAKAVERKLTGEQVDWSLEYEMPISESIDVFRSYIKAWYEGDLQKVFFAEKIDPTIKNQICSVLAGHVRDTTNPFVKKHKTIIKTLAKVLEIQNRK